MAEAKGRVICYKINDKDRSGPHTISFFIVKSIDFTLRGQEKPNVYNIAPWKASNTKNS